jgi:6-phosphogluconolactonase (cycloisomerase 2 family)
LSDRQVSIDIGANAVLDGGAIYLIAQAEDRSFASLIGASNLLDNVLISPLADKVAGLTAMPVKVLVKESQADIVVHDGARLSADGAIGVYATAKADATGVAYGSLFSIGYALGKTTATVDIQSNVLINAGDAVVITAGAESTSHLETNTDRSSESTPNPGSAQIAVSLAVANADATSHVTVAERATVTAGKTANIGASGVVDSEAVAESSIFSDGKAGLAFGLQFSRADIQTTVNGKVTAHMADGSVVKIEIDPTVSEFDYSSTQTVDGLRPGKTVKVASAVNADLPSGTIFKYLGTDLSGSVDLATSAQNYADVGLWEAHSPNLGYVDLARNMIYVGANALATEDTILYSNRRGNSIAGLVDGSEYVVIKLVDDAATATRDESKWVQLAETEQKAIDGDARTLGYTPAAPPVAVNSKGFSSADVKAEKDEITLANPAFTGSGVDFSLLGQTFELGQAVVYHEGSAPIAGLRDGETYYIITGTNEFNLIGDQRFVGEQQVKLAETENEARAGIAIGIGAVAADASGYSLAAKHVLDSGFATGIGVQSSLAASDKAQAGAGLQSEDLEKSSMDKAKEVINANLPDLIFQALTKDYRDNAAKSNSGASNTLSVAGGLAYGFADHTVLTTIGSNAELKSNEDLEVRAEIEEKFQLISESDSDPQEEVNGNSAGSSAANSISVAVAVGNISNTATATVESGAQLDALRANRVIAGISYPFLTRPDAFTPTTLGELIDSLQTEGVGAVDKYLDGYLGIRSGLFNSWARSTATADKVGIAGSVNVLSLTNTSKAIVAGGALINQDADWHNNALNAHANQAAQRADGRGEEVVSVEATTYMQTVDMTGIFGFNLPSGTLDPFSPDYDRDLSLQPVGAAGKKGGFGGALFISVLNNTTHATIADGARIYSGSDGGLNMKAEEAIFNFAFNQAGGGGGKYGIGGTVSYVEQHSDTLVQLGSSAFVSGRNARLYAGSLETLINWNGGISKGEGSGLGASVAITDIERKTRAVIGAIDPGASGGSGARSEHQIDVAEGVELLAKTDGALWTFAIAGAVVSDEPMKQTAEDPLDGESAPGTAGTTVQEAPAKTGVGIAAAVSINTITDITQASIDDAGTILARTLTLQSSNDTDLIAATGGLAFAKPDQSNNAAALAGAFSKNIVSATTRAFVQGTAATLSGSTGTVFSVAATRDSEIVAIAAGAGGSLATGQSSSGGSGNTAFSLAGSVSINRIGGATEAFLSGSAIGLSGGQATLLARDTSDIFAIGGGLSLSFAKGGAGGNTNAASFGVAVAINRITSPVTAYLDDSSVSILGSGGFELHATADTTIKAYTLGAAVSAVSGTQGGGIAGAGGGSGSINTINADAIAALRNGSQVSSSVGTVKVAASNTSDITADAGGFALSLALGSSGSSNAAAFGAGFAVNNIGSDEDRNVVEAIVDDSTVGAGDGFELDAVSMIGISALTIGAAGAVNGQQPLLLTGSLAGAFSVNTVRASTLAKVRAGSSVSSTHNAVRIKADEQTAIVADAGGFAFSLRKATSSGASLSIGASLALNDIANFSEASVDASQISSGGAITLDATSTGSIDALTMAGALSATLGGNSLNFGFAGAGTGSGNKVTNSLQARLLNGARLTSQNGGAVSVTASDERYAFDLSGVSAAQLNDAGKQDEDDDNTPVNEASVDQSGDATIRASLKTAFAAQGVDFDSHPTVSTITAGSTWLVSEEGGAAYVLRLEYGLFKAYATTLIHADAGAVAIALGFSKGGGQSINASVGASAAVNSVSNTIAADADAATVEAAGDVVFDATSTATINVLTIAGAGGGSVSSGQGFGVTLAGAGTGSGNSVSNTVRAMIGNGSTVSSGASHDIVLRATDASFIDARGIAGALSISGGEGAAVALGISIASNDIGNSVEALIDRSEVNSGAALTLLADSRSVINSLTVGAAVSISAGGKSLALSGSGAGASSTNTIDNTVEAAIEHGQPVSTAAGSALLLSAGDRSRIDATAVAGSVAIAGSSNGLSGAIAIAAAIADNDIGNTVKATIGDGSVVDAGGTISLNASAESAIDALAVGVAVSAAVSNPSSGLSVSLAGAGASATNPIHNTVAAQLGTSGGASSRIDAAGAVSLTASDTSSITANVPAIAVSLSTGGSFAVGVSLSENTITSTVDASVENAVVDILAGNLALNADSIATVDAELSPVTASIGIAAAALSGANGVSTVGGHTQSWLGGGADVTLHSGRADLAAASTVNAKSAAKGGSGSTGLAVNALQATTSIARDTTAFVGSGASLRGDGLRVQATSNYSATSDLLGVALGVAAGSLGRSEAYVTGDTEAHIGAGKGRGAQAPAIVDVAGGDIDVVATSHNTATAIGKGGGGGGLAVSIFAADAGIGSGGGSVGHGDAATRAFVGEGASIVGGTLDLEATASDVATSDMLVVSIGVVGGGGAFATAVGKGEVEAFIDSGPAEAGIGVGVLVQPVALSGAVKVVATSNETLNASAAGGAGGGIAVAGMTATTTSDSDVRAYLGDGAGVSSAGLTLKADAQSRSAEATITVGAAGIAGGAGGKAQADSKGRVAAYLGSDATVVSPLGKVTIEARNANTHAHATANGGAGGGIAIAKFIAQATVEGSTEARVDEGAQIGAAGFTLRADASDYAESDLFTLGIGVGAGAIGDATATATASTSAAFGSPAGIQSGTPTRLDATGNVLIESTADQEAQADADSISGGGIAVGSIRTNANLTGSNEALVGDNAIVKTFGSFTLRSESTVDADSDADGGGGSLIAQIDSASATSTLHDQTASRVRTGANVNANGALLIEATQNLILDAVAEIDNGGLGTEANSTATGTIDATGVSAEIGAATLIGQTLTVRADVRKIDAVVDADSDSGAFITNSNASSSLDTSTDASVLIHTGADLKGRDTLTLGAYHNRANIASRIDTGSKATANGSSIGGGTDASATNRLTAATRVDVDAGATLHARDLIVEAKALGTPIYAAIATADGALIDNPIATTVKALSADSSIDFDATVIMFGAPSPDLLIDAAGNVIRQQNIGFTRVGDEIRIDNIANSGALSGSLRFAVQTFPVANSSASGDTVSTSAVIRGEPVFEYRTGYESVSIGIASDTALHTGLIDVINRSATFSPSVSVSARDASAFDYSTRSDPGKTLIIIDNASDKAIRVAGNILSPYGRTRIESAQGSIVAANGALRIETDSAELRATSGAIGSAATPLRIDSKRLRAESSAAGLYIHEIAGDLLVEQAHAVGGTVQLHAAGSILDGNSGPFADIVGAEVLLIADAGSIGSFAEPLQIDASATSLHAQAQGDIVVEDIVGALGVGQVVSQAGSIRLATRDANNSDAEDIMLGDGSVLRALQGDITLWSGDDVIVPGTASISAGGVVRIAGDHGKADAASLGVTLDLRGSLRGSAVELQTGIAADTVVLAQALSDTTLNTGDNNDLIRVGSMATATANTLGRLDSVAARLDVQGGAGVNRLDLDDSGGSNANEGTLEAGQLSGLGMAAAIGFSEIDELKLRLGSGADRLRVLGTQAGRTTQVLMGEGADILVAGDTAGVVKNGLNAIAGLLDVQGQGGDDALQISDQVSGAAAAERNVGELSALRLTGLGMGNADPSAVNRDAGIAYAEFESLSLQLGDGIDELKILGTSTATGVNLGAGVDVVSIGDLTPTSSLNTISSALNVGGGADGGTLAVASGAAVDLRLERDPADSTLGLLSEASMAGSIRYGGFDALTLALGDGADKLRVLDTLAALELSAGAGADELTIDSVSHATRLQMGDGADRVTVHGAQARLTIAGQGATLEQDALLVDLGARTLDSEGSLVGSADAGSLLGFTVGDIDFSGIEQFTLQLGAGNDRLRIDDSLAATAVSVCAGDSDDVIDVYQIGTRTTTINGDAGKDTVSVHIDGEPVAGTFTQLALSVEQLVVDNRLNETMPVAWTVVDGALIRARSGGGSEVPVIAAEGAGEIRILGGTQADTLDVLSGIPGDVRGVIDGNSVDLTAGRVVLEPGSFRTLLDYPVVIDFDELSGSTSSYDREDGFTLSSNDTLLRNNDVGPAAKLASGRIATLSSASGAFSAGSILLAADDATSRTVRFTGVTLNGLEVVVEAVAPGRDPVSNLPVFARYSFTDPGMRALSSLRWEVVGSGALLIDSIVAGRIDTTAAASPQPQGVATFNILGDVRFDVAKGWLWVISEGVQIDDDGNGSIDRTLSAGFGYRSGAGFTSAVGSDGITRFYLPGNLKIADGATVTGIATNAGNAIISNAGQNGLSIQVANDVSIGAGVSFDFSASTSNPGVGGGGGGGQVSGGTAGWLGSGGSAGWGGSGGRGGDLPRTAGNDDLNGVAGSGGHAGYDGNDGYSGGTGTAGNAGSAGQNNPNSGGAGGAAGALGTPGLGATTGGEFGGNGSGGPYDFWGGSDNDGSNGGTGVAGADGTPGSGGEAGTAGSPGSNTVVASALTSPISGGGAGGSGGSGGGGGGGGGGKGGGGGGAGGGEGGSFTSDNRVSGKGGNGGDGGDGGDGGQGGSGGIGGAGGSGGGAIELFAYGRITVESSASFDASGGDGGIGGGIGAPLRAAEGGNSASGDQTNGGGGGGDGKNGGAGGDGGAAGAGGPGGPGAGGAGGTVKLVGSVLEANGATVNTDGGLAGGNPDVRIAGSGIEASYTSTRLFGGSTTVSRSETVIYQGYGSDGFAGLPAPGFLYNLSARWFGQIEVRAEDPQVPAAQNVRFRVSSDGGARFYVYGLNGVSQWTTAINDGGSHDYAPAYSSTYSMAPGKYWIQLDYSNTSGFSGIALEYQTSTDAWRSVSVAYDGGDGRLILAANTGISPSSLSSAPSTLGGQPASVVAARSELLRGPRLDNPYVTDLSGASAALDDSPYIAGLDGGAEIYGLLQGIDKSGLDFNPATTQKDGLPTTEGDAVFAVMRLDIGPGDYADDYTGFDMLLFVNLADDVALSDPRLIVSQSGNAVGTQALAIDGVGTFQHLTALGAKQVWATLIPDSENLKFDASVQINGQTVMLDNQALARNQVVYGKFAPSLLAEASLNGLAAIALSPYGKQIYAVDPRRNALVVINASDLSERQLFKNGDDGISGLAGASNVAVSPDGMRVYVVSPGSQSMLVFPRDTSTGNLSVAPTLAGASGVAAFDTLAVNVAGTQVYTAGATYLFAYDAAGNWQGYNQSNFAFVNQISSLAVSQDGSLVLAASASQDSLWVLDNGLGLLQSIAGADVGLQGPSGIAVSGDDAFVYVTAAGSHSLAVFARNGNVLSHVQTLINGSDGVRGLLGASDVVLSADQRLVMVSGAENNAVAVFERNSASGSLGFVQLLRQNVGGVDGLLAASSLVTTASGDTVFVGSLGDTGVPGGIARFANVTVGVALPPPVHQLTTFTGIEDLGVTLAGGDDRVTLRNAPEARVETLRIDTGAGKDRVVLSDLGVLNTEVRLGANEDLLQLRSQRADTHLLVDGEGGADIFEIPQVGAGAFTEISGGSGPDSMRVTGAGLPASATTILHGSDIDGFPYDTLSYDPGLLSAHPSAFSQTAGTLQLGLFDFIAVSVQPLGYGVVSYDSFEAVEVIAAPVVFAPGAALRIAEGDELPVSVRVGSYNGAVAGQWTVNPLGAGNALSEPLSWDIDGDGRFGEVSGSSFTLSWQQLVDFGLADNGQYQIAVKATNGSGFESVGLATLIIDNTPPQIQLSGAGSTLAGEVYSLDFSAGDPGDDRVSAWRVDWSDGSPVEDLGSNAQHARHVFGEPGSYSVLLTGTDEDTAVSVTKTVSVGVSSAQVSVGGPYTIMEGDALTLRASAVGTPIEVQWELNGDSSFDVTTSALELTRTWAQLQALSGTPINDNGRFAPRVSVRYASGDVVLSAPGQLEVLNTAPTASVASSGAVSEGQDAKLRFSAPSDASDADRAAGFTYSVVLDTLFGHYEDSVTSTASAVELLIPAAYILDNGSYLARARITDQDGGYSEQAVSVVVLEVAPTLIVQGEGNAVEGADYRLDLSASDPGADSVSRWLVDWDDGSGSVESFDGATQSLSHRFADDGLHSIRISAFDEDGSTQASKQVSVLNAAPTLSDLAVTSTSEGAITVLSGSITDPGVLDSFSLDIDWGDGTSESVALAAGTSSFALKHRYLDDDPSGTPADIRSIAVTLRDDDGDSSAASVDTTVSNAAPEFSGLGTLASRVDESGLAKLVGEIVDAGILDTHLLSIDWGDGSASEEVAVDPQTRAFLATHRYADDNPTATGEDVYTISAQVSDDDGGNASASTTVTIVNRAPSISGLQLSEVLGSDSSQATLTGSFSDLGTSDTHVVLIDWGDDSPEESAVLDAGGLSFSAGHVFSFLDAPGYQLSVRVIDDDLGVASASVHTTAYPVNRAPTAVDDEVSGDENTPIALDLLTNDSDLDGDLLSAFVLTQPEHGTLLSLGSGRFSYLGNPDFTGDDSFSYVARDARVGSNVAQVRLVVVPRNSAPTAADDRIESTEDTAVTFDVRDNDSDPENDALSVQVVDLPQHGSLLAKADGSFSYTPVLDFNGTDTFSYRVSDGNLLSNLAIVSVVLAPVNDSPSLAEIADATLFEGQTFRVSAAGSDVDLLGYVGDTLGYALDVAPAGASIDADSAAIVWQALDGDANGSTHEFTVRVSDASGESATQSFKVKVLNVAPTLTATGLEASYIGEDFVLDLTSSDPGLDTISEWHIDWGDGQIVDYSGNPGRISHVYSSVLGKVLIRATASDEDGSYLLDPLQVVVLPLPLQVESLSYDSNGFAVRFNDAFNAGVIKLYDSSLVGLGAADLVLTGSSGLVKGSLVFDADYRGLRYQVSGNGLAAGSYSLTLKSGAQAFHSIWSALDGNADGLAGDDFLRSFTVAAAPALKLSLPDFVRGPGQSVDVPAAGSQLPLTLLSPGNVRQLSFVVRYDPLLLLISSSRPGAALPADARLDFSGSLPGELRVTISSLTAIAAGTVTLLDLVASVPATAPYGAAQILDIDEVSVNGQALNGADDDALQVVGYLGDGDASGRLDRRDVMLIQRNATNADSGFAAWSVVDPRLLADVDLDGRITTRDMVRVSQEMNRYDSALIPNLPTNVPLTFAPAQAWPAAASSGQTLPQINFGDSFASFAVGSDDPRNKRENWRTSFVTNMASNSVNPNSRLQVTLAAVLQSTTSL